MRIFLSYAEEDREVGALIADGLTAGEHRVFDWRAPSQRGGRFQEEIVRRVGEADVFIALLSPAYQRSDWCRREVALAIQREGHMRSDDPEAIFIQVVLVASVRPPDAGFLGAYDWLDMTNRDQRGTALAQLVDRFRPPKQPAAATSTDFRVLPKPKDQVFGPEGDLTFRNRDDEVRKVVSGLTTFGGRHFWLVMAPPQLGKSWFLKRVAADPELLVPDPWVVQQVDLRSEPVDLRTSTGALLTRLFGLRLPTTTEREALIGIAQEVIRTGRPHLCLLDSAELLREPIAKELRACMSEIYAIVARSPRSDVRLAFIVATRGESKRWLGVAPKPGFEPLTLTQFTIDVVRQVLNDLAAAMGKGFSQAFLSNYAPLVHKFTEGLPALLTRCMEWIRAQVGVEVERLETARLFDELVRPYVREELLASTIMLPTHQWEIDEPLRALVNAYRVLVPYRFFTLSHLRHRCESDAGFQEALTDADWKMEDLGTAISATPLLKRPLNEPWQEIDPPIRRLLYRYFYESHEDRASAHCQARKFVEVWTEGLNGKEQALGLVECLWHEANTLAIRSPADMGPTLIESARKMSLNIQDSPAYARSELREFTVNRMQNDEELQDAINSVEIFDRLVEVVTRPPAASAEES